MSDSQVLFLAIVALVWATEAIRVVTRRRLVEAWVAKQGWTLAKIRYRVRLWEVTGNRYFDVQVIEPSGRVVEGVAKATGRIRSRVSIDWHDSSRGGM